MELPYIFRVALTMMAMYLAYKAFMSRETFHALNRAAILVSAAVSFVIPLLKIPAIFATKGSATTYAAIDIGEITATVIDEPTTSITDYWPYLIMAGAAVFLLRFLVSTISIALQAAKNKKITLKGGIWLIISETIKSPVSWLKYIFMNHKDYNENNGEILAHEMAHIRLKHSIDLILMDIVCCVQWFNPAAWLLRSELCTVHEFQADKAVLDSGYNAKKYQTLLIKKAAGRNWNSVASSLNHSNLKKRITMMSNQKKSASATFKALLPMAVAAICAFAFSDCNSAVAQSTTTNNVLTGESNVMTQVTVIGTGTPSSQDKAEALNNYSAQSTVYVEHGNKAKNINNLIPDDLQEVSDTKESAAKQYNPASYASDSQAIENKAESDNVSTIENINSSADSAPVQTTSATRNPNDSIVYMIVEQMPEYPGGEEALRKHIAENIRNSEAAKEKKFQGTVFVDFIVDQNGKVTQPNIRKSSGNQDLDNEAIRIVNTLQDFIPGRQRGKNVSVSFVIPITFAITVTDNH